MTELVMLATEDEDIGLWPKADADVRAMTLARSLKTTVTVRDPVSDEVLIVVKATA